MRTRARPAPRGRRELPQTQTHRIVLFWHEFLSYFHWGATSSLVVSARTHECSPMQACTASMEASSALLTKLDAGANDYRAHMPRSIDRVSHAAADIDATLSVLFILRRHLSNQVREAEHGATRAPTMDRQS